MKDLDKVVSILTKEISDKKGEAIKIYMIDDPQLLLDCSIVVTALNDSHVRAVLSTVNGAVDTEISSITEELVIPPRHSGDAKSGWIIVDMGSIVVHIMTEQQRTYYDIDNFLEQSSGMVFH